MVSLPPLERAVRLEWNLYRPRFRVEPATDTEVSQDPFTFEVKNFLGTDTVTVEAQKLTFSQHGLFRQQSTIQLFHVLAAIGLLLIEALIDLIVRRARKR